MIVCTDCGLSFNGDENYTHGLTEGDAGTYCCPFCGEVICEEDIVNGP